MGDYRHIVVKQNGETVRITMNRPERRKSLSGEPPPQLLAAESAGFALPGGKGGWFCHTPAVPVARAVGRKRLMEMALTGDVVDALTAEQWGLVNRTVPDAELDAAVDDLLARATRGIRDSKAVGKQTLY